ncbi:hypothetical protein C8R44DRAFT_865433 [Mycena epipterygia]|nr:hypothetical protein C8R44DRAFT_865433 [Mycena epipterygia]
MNVTTPDNTFGLLLVAVVISAALFGAGVLQFWMYIRKYHSHDSIYIQAVVIAVLICDAAQQGALAHAGTSFQPVPPQNYLTLFIAYKYLVSSITNPAIFVSVVKSVAIQSYFGCAIAIMVQQFYCWRIYKIGTSVVLAIAVSLVSWSACVLLLVTGVKFDKLSFLPDTIKLKRLVIVAMALSAGADTTISLVLVYLLHSSKRGFKRSTDMINRLIVFTSSTGLPTSVFALLTTVSIAVFPNTLLYILFFQLMGRLYTNSLLVTLNSREYIKSVGELAGQEFFSLEIATRPTNSPPAQQDPIAVRIETDVMRAFDVRSPFIFSDSFNISAA